MIILVKLTGQELTCILNLFCMNFVNPSHTSIEMEPGISRLSSMGNIGTLKH